MNKELQTYIDNNFAKITKARKLSKANIMKLKHAEFIRMDGTGYYQFVSLDKLNKSVKVKTIKGTDWFDYEDVLKDDACKILNKLFAASKTFQEMHGIGVGESSLKDILKQLDKFVDKPFDILDCKKK